MQATITDPEEGMILATGSSFAGYLTTNTAVLASKLGDPTRPNGDGYKTDVEWVIRTPFGIATIYNWKDGKNYLGKEGLLLHQIRDWHIGAKEHKEEVVEFVKDLLEEK